MATRPPPRDIDEYIAGFPDGVQTLLQEIRTTIAEAAPGAAEAIRYQIPTFILNGNLVHFAAFNQHIGFYPTPDGMAAFEGELSAYPSGKGSVQFPLDRPLPLDLIRRIVEFRMRAKVKSSPGRGKS